MQFDSILLMIHFINIFTRNVSTSIYKLYYSYTVQETHEYSAVRVHAQNCNFKYRYY